MIIQTRSKKTYLERIQSKDKEIRQGIEAMIKNFENFSMEKYGKAEIIEDIKLMNNEQVFDLLQSWIDWNTLSSGTIKFYFSKLKSYLHYFGIKLHPQDIKEELTFKRQIQEELYPLTVNDIQTITKNLRYKHKTLFICQSSSLMRIGEMMQLRKKHLIADKKNIIVKIPASIAKFKKGRTTFFSKEASRLLRPILRELDENDLVFGTSEYPKHSKITAQGVLRNAHDRIGLNMKYETTGRYMINTHCFRAFGITRLSRHDPNFAKKIAGQKSYLLQYDRMTDEEKLELYQKHEIDLLIDDSAITQAELEKIQNEKSEQTQKDNEQRKRMQEMEERMQEMQKEMVLQRSAFVFFKAQMGMPTQLNLQQLESQNNEKSALKW
ncbi:site-specific integrase [Nitrosopumilus sp.]|uniref:site-specific integrase n=1 Tax=Nitrosopumilus sp. TaxID=2024843 RepID=UPI00247C50FC|nr:site-specific integrase [Nitrosopumilus sp.]MCV0409920.1 site-specific integrase [Nitrosopumilus sp.]